MISDPSLNENRVDFRYFLKIIGVNMMKERYLCPECGRKVAVKVCKQTVTSTIRKEEVEYVCHIGICPECGAEVPVKEFESERAVIPAQRYCRSHNLVTLNEINEVIRIYDVDKRQLPFIMSVGEHTLERYMKGQIPNTSNSALLKSFLSNYINFENIYYENCEDPRITDNTRRKVERSLERIRRLNSVSSKLDAAALYIINSKYEVTNLALQKLLYYADAINILKYGQTMFEQECEAWVHGPVYPAIYRKYKEFGKEEIRDCHLNESYLDKLSNEEKEVLDYVLNNLAIYNGTILEIATHKEKPWQEQRIGYADNEPGTDIIEKDRIKAYFLEISKQYDLLKKEDMQQYIQMIVC